MQRQREQYKRGDSESPFTHLFEKLEKAHSKYGEEKKFSALDVLAMLHFAMPKGLGWDFAYALSLKANCTREEAEKSLEYLRQTTMELGARKRRDAVCFSEADYESTTRSLRDSLVFTGNLAEMDY